MVYITKYKGENKMLNVIKYNNNILTIKLFKCFYWKQNYYPIFQVTKSKRKKTLNYTNNTYDFYQ